MRYASAHVRESLIINKKSTFLHSAKGKVMVSTHKKIIDLIYIYIFSFFCQFRNQYDNDVATWSPQGRIHQIEYAMEAVKQVC